MSVSFKTSGSGDIEQAKQTILQSITIAVPQAAPYLRDIKFVKNGTSLDADFSALPPGLSAKLHEVFPAE